MPQTFDTFSGADSALTAYQILDVPKTPSVRTGAQFMRLFGLATGTAADTVTIELALVQDGNRIGSWTATGTLTALTGAGSKKLMTISFDEGSSSKFDLLGCDDYRPNQIQGQTAPDSKAFWMIGITAVSGASNIDLYASYSGAI